MLSFAAVCFKHLLPQKRLGGVCLPRSLIARPSEAWNDEEAGSDIREAKRKGLVGRCISRQRLHNVRLRGLSYSGSAW